MSWVRRRILSVKRLIEERAVDGRRTIGKRMNYELEALRSSG